MYICDCGQRYSSLEGLAGCVGAKHFAAIGNELADAEREARLSGAEPSEPVMPSGARMSVMAGIAPASLFPELSPLDILRRCPPSAELVDLLVKQTHEHLQKGANELAAELLSLALCARSARRGERPLG